MAVGADTFPEMHPVKGFRLGATKAGIKKPDRRDLVMMEALAGSTIAGTFTLNAFCAAPVTVCKRNLMSLGGAAQQNVFLITNTGYANAGTGTQGMANAESVCQHLAEQVSVPVNHIFPFSTGVIGEPLPVDRVVAGIPDAINRLSESGWADAAVGIMTTDTRAKGASVQLNLQGKVVTITGISKGAGMIKPNMATMLGYVATDAAVAPDLLQLLASQATQASFNSITVDSDTSTNDSCLLVATGQSGVTISESAVDDLEAFSTALQSVFLQLAHAIIRDGEGATKFVAVQVEQARSADEAREVAYTIAHSPLIKTALFACDPNWGRILAAVGRAPIPDLAVEGVSVYLNHVLIAEQGGVAASYTEAAGSAEMQKEEITIRVGLSRGDAQATIWTTDLSYDYVKINADYRS
ncbi:bifunctional glutamate N-acetyltransferase/amino-acid acetyltransferase ArgJ [Ketobacter sp. MCCC 1A13808]|uniref:bifunctional glutamate N-acetyltransferase/amino-acid acetyltransferase ArgJ n=1 Tax=Ketobacter sp. MCCC 1A13808 TaxID=2602738 RepID=UPI0012EBFA08|nr:bifunctional glutamate N-acetyltransferase/amino-acid acetyltransferase ArgJ [Ketobacter sp. MCCC 1A13808]MVF11194.1 bifunctional glutamate N-acetyltransferase/amino-acid acetyltransferase ArgJ [Ketobacter sp. MCCC 1A13808]